MGLTIHYNLASHVRSPKRARQLIEQLHKCATALPFKSVGPIHEFAGDSCDFSKQPDDHPQRWMLIQASADVRQGRFSYNVPPNHLIGFETRPGPGCEPANFGLGGYPAFIDVEDRTVWPHQKRRIRTGLTGWRWGSFCKTQYASQHGVAHFLKCHLLVIRMLDKAKELGLLNEVSDEGNFWVKRDVKALANEVGEWNRDMAALVGRMKDLVGPKLEAAIFAFPDFEHLEAEGRKHD